jgi:hypothetical protein
MIEQRGNPRELAERMAGLPDGQYRVYVQLVQSREEILAGFERTTEALRRNPPRETAGMTDDSVMDWADNVVQEIRQAHRSAK